jgi:FMN reductase
MESSNIERVLGISGSITSGSKTRTAVEHALAGARATYDVETDVVHLGEYDVVPADGRPLDDYEGDTAAALDAIVAADAYVIGTPVYRGSYSGVLKNLFDMIPRGMWQADVAPLESAAVGLVATGATPHHYLTIDQELRPIMGFFGACTVGGVYAHGDQFEDGELVDEDVAHRLAALGAAVVDIGATLDDSDAMGRLGPQF